MNLDLILPPLKGKKLLDRLHNKERRSIIAEGLIYEQTILMLAADPGVGKSTLTTQMAVELTSGLPLFNYFHVPEPIKVLYIQTERGVIELLERLAVISKTYPLNTENLLITDEYQKLNLLNNIHADTFLECLKRDAKGVKVIFLDPIYSTVSGGLSNDIPASTFTRVFSRVQKELDCALVYNHHTVKESYDRDGQVIQKADPFYGSQWIKAHVTGSYIVKSTDTGGVVLTLRKDNYHLLAPKIELEFDNETGLCSIVGDSLQGIDKLRNYLRIQSINKEGFTFNDIQEATKLCTRTIRELLMHSSIKDTITVVNIKRNKKIYKIVEV